VTLFSGLFIKATTNGLIVEATTNGLSLKLQQMDLLLEQE